MPTPLPCSIPTASCASLNSAMQTSLASCTVTNADGSVSLIAKLLEGV